MNERPLTSSHWLKYFGISVCLAFIHSAPAWCAAADRPTLKDAFADDFRVGAAVSTVQITGGEPAALALVEQQFNSITSENLFKWEEVQPRPGEFSFGPADRFVEFGEKHDMFLVGHTLVWHEQTPAWVFLDEAGNLLDRSALLERMRDHIHAVVGRYRGRMDGWDVVNEAMDEAGRRRQSPWQIIIGEDYIEKAFQFAHEADPDAQLYYNDASEWLPGKRRGYARLVHELRSKGFRIDGIGLQGHWGMVRPTRQEMEAMFEDYGRLGVKIMITELDVFMLPEADPNRDYGDLSLNLQLKHELDPYADGLPDEVGRAVAARYAEIFACLLLHRDKIDRVTFWGVHDGHSWLNNWPMSGRTAYPLLFDRRLKPKPALEAVLQTAEPIR